MFGDQGAGRSGQAVIDLAARESADLILVLGDLSYGYGTPEEYMALYDERLGDDFPVLVLVGNHEEDEWPTFKRLFEQRLSRTPAVSCEGDYGVKGTCRYEGITIVSTAPGIRDTPGVNEQEDYVGYIQDVLSRDDAPFSICAWHENMRRMQVGGKGDSVGWGVYEACRENGAIVATGHEHSYSRTHLMSSFEAQRVQSRSNSLTLSEGASFAFVSGLGGASIRDQQLDGDWWASIYTENQGADYGALFCDFNINGDPKAASCYFKNIQDEVIDRFELVSDVDSDDGPGGVTNLTRRIRASDDDAEEQLSTGVNYIISSDLELTEEGGRGQQLIGMRFRDISIPAESEILSAALQFEVDEAGDRPTNLTLRAEASLDSAAFEQTPNNISSRPTTSAAVNWNSLPAVEPNDALASPDIKTIVQEVIDQDGWQLGSALTVLISGTGKRVVEAWDGESAAAPILFVEYKRRDSQGPPEFSISDVSVSESAAVARLAVTATPPPDRPTRIWVATADETAQQGQDYYGMSANLEFSAGEASQTVDVTVLNDTQVENLEKFGVRIFNTTYGRIARGRAAVEIVDDDLGAREITVSDVQVGEDVGDATVTLRLSPASATPVSVDVATRPETARNGQDYYGIYQKVRFEAGQDSAEVRVKVLDDLVAESSSEFFNVRLFNAEGASVVRPVAKVTILDND